MSKIKHFIETQDLTKEDYLEILERAVEYQKNPEKTRHLCEGKTIATMMFKASTRTGTMAQTAMQKMGGGWVGIQGTAGTYIETGEEDEEDIMRSVAAYTDIMVVRHKKLNLYDFADTFPIPLMNGLCGNDEHTIGGVLFLYSVLRHFGRLDNIKLGLYGQTVNSRPFKTVEKILSFFNAKMYEDSVLDELATPPHIIKFVEEHGSTFEKAKLKDFIGEIDVLLIQDGMPSLGVDDPKIMAEYTKRFATMTPKDFEPMRKDAIFYYEQPRAMMDGRLTVSKEVDSDPRSMGQAMMGEGIYPMMALITYLLEKSGK